MKLGKQLDERPAGLLLAVATGFDEETRFNFTRLVGEDGSEFIKRSRLNLGRKDIEKYEVSWYEALGE